MLMHSKSILHRDLKSQNLFLTKDKTIKIGDFGISKELDTKQMLANTACGTPYFMPPEVCKGEPYGTKADIWTIGCIIYELAMLKKPFEGNSMTSVFNDIINKKLDDIPDTVNTDVKMLIMFMLEKDPNWRPSIWEISNYPCISSRLKKFVEEKKC